MSLALADPDMTFEIHGVPLFGFSAQWIFFVYRYHAYVCDGLLPQCVKLMSLGEQARTPVLYVPSFRRFGLKAARVGDFLHAGSRGSPALMFGGRSPFRSQVPR
jgi:hypothetical protein